MSEINIVIQQSTNKIDIVMQPLINQNPIEIVMTKPGASVTTANVKAALDITTLSGSNTGDQDLSDKQATLVSGSNIKTINSAPILGAGDLVIAGGGGGVASVRSVIGTSTAGWTTADCDYLCDGTADDVEINAAITALPANGGEVLILDGTYNMADSIKITSRSNVSICGNGNTTILKRMYDSTTAANPGVISLITATYCSIKDLQIYGGVADANIHMSSSSNNTITGNTFASSTVGIDIFSCNNNIISGNVVTDMVRALYIKHSSDYNVISSNICNNSSYSGIELSDSSNNAISGNILKNCTRGIRLLGYSDDNTVSGNAVNGGYRGIILAGSGSAILGNTLKNFPIGIILSYATNSVVTGNNCMKGTGATTDYTASQYTIHVVGSSNNLISSNQCMGKAVVIEGGASNTEINNKFA